MNCDEIYDASHQRGYEPVFVHLIWANEKKFCVPLIEALSRKSDELNPMLHIFVTPHKALADDLCGKYKNVFLDDSGTNLFNEYGAKGALMVSHSLPKSQLALFIKRKYKRRTIYRYWGGRTQHKFEERKSLADKCLFRLYRRAFRLKYSGFNSIGTAGIIDYLDLCDLLGDMSIYTLPYGDSGMKRAISVNVKKKRQSNELDILIGHRSDPQEKHLKYISMFGAVNESNVRLFIPLAYGDMDYAKTVEHFIDSHGFSNVIVMREMLPSDDYVRFLSNMDVCIFDLEGSCALGNISYLLSLEKPVYVPRGSLLDRAMAFEGIPHGCIEDISASQLEDLGSDISVDSGELGSFSLDNRESFEDSWIHALNLLLAQK